jgi:nucleotide-binding universal stress UspA family protein
VIVMSHPSHLLVLVGTDFSAQAQNALAVARDLVLRTPGAELHVVHVVAPSAAAVGISGIGPNLATELTEGLARARAELQAVCRAGDALASRTIGHLRSGDAATEITRVAESLQADLIVVGTHGLTGLERLLMGSVAESVTRHAPCSVLTTRIKTVIDDVQIEPACEACTLAKTTSVNPNARCAAHPRKSARPHTYSEGRSPEGHETFRFDS